MNPEEPKTADQTAAKAIKALTPAETNEKEVTLQPLAKYVSDYYETLKDGAEIEGLYTGFNKIDFNLRGLRQTTVLAGSPKTGKTSFCTQLITQIAAYNGNHTDSEGKVILQKQAVLFYSLEMSKSDITTKLISQLSGVGYWKIRLNRGTMEEAGKMDSPEVRPDDFVNPGGKTDKTRLMEAEKKRRQMDNIFIRDLNDYTEKRQLNFDTLKEDIKAVKEQTGAAELIVFIDHLQVFPIDKKEYKDQIEKEGELIKKFNEIAITEKVAMFLISQTNKEAMKDSKDRFRDLKEAKEDPDIDTLLSGVKGSVDTVYIASGIWTLLKTGREKFIENGKGHKQDLHVKILALHITERNSPGGLFYLLYFPIEQRFKFVEFHTVKDELVKEGFSQADALALAGRKDGTSQNPNKNKGAK